MLDPEDHRQRSSAGCSSEREQPRRCRRRVRNRVDRLHCGRWRKPAGADLVDCSHGGDYTIHIHTSGIGGADGDQFGAPVCGLKSQLSPMRNNSGVQIKLVAEPLGCRQGLVRRLTVDVQYAAKVRTRSDRPCKLIIACAEIVEGKGAVIRYRLLHKLSPSWIDEATKFTPVTNTIARRQP